MGRRQYAVHRWLGALAGLQLFLWSLGGFVFATHDIDWVRGARGQNPDALGAVAVERVRVSPADAVAALGEIGAVDAVTLRPLLGRPVYEVRHAGGVALVDAETGRPASPIDEQTARAVALADRLGSPAVASVRLIERDPPTEYRGGALPAWRVDLDDDDDTHVYVAADTGRVSARRNDAWRRFDFFWMLHTMDYRGRDDFNHALLIGFAGLGLVTVGSGGVLWLARVRRRRRRSGASRPESR